MARIVKEHEYAKKRNEVLDAAQRLIFTKGYEQMTIQDLLSELRISSGAFYHYFDSKPGLLEAFIERLNKESEKPILPIVNDPILSAIEKLQGFFNAFDQKRIEHKTELAKLQSVWYNDANAVVRDKVNEAVITHRAPLLNKIVQQGIREGVFTAAYPAQAGEVILSLLQGMGSTHARLLQTSGTERDERSLIERIVTIHAAYMDAIERMLGAFPNTLYRIDADVVEVWVNAIKDDAENGLD